MSKVYDQWLDSRLHDSDEFMHEFEMRTERYLETEWNPQDYEIFLEALFDSNFDAWKSELTAAIAQGSFGTSALGEIIWVIVNEFCESKAKQLAKQDMEKS